MPDSKRFLHPEAIKRISRLELRARHIVEGFLTGMHRSPYFGQSVEFLQHREYTAGDDLRYVDWKVWARQDRLYVKQFEEETNLRCTMLVDVSRSMAYGNGPLSKYEYACTVASSLAYLILRQHDAVGCLAFDDRIRNRVPSRSKQNHVLSIVEALSVSEPRDKTDLYSILRGAAESLPRRGMVVLVSDLLADVEGTLKGLKMLRQRVHAEHFQQLAAVLVAFAVPVCRIQHVRQAGIPQTLGLHAKVLGDHPIAPAGIKFRCFRGHDRRQSDQRCDAEPCCEPSSKLS